MRVVGWGFLVAAIFTCTGFFRPLLAQDNSGAAEAIKYLPEESIGTVTVWPARTAKLPRFSLAPLEVASASGLEQIGIDPLTIQRIDVMFSLPGPAGPQLGAVIQMAEPVALNDLNPQVFGDDGEQDEKGFKYRVFDGPPNPEIVLHQAGPKTVLLGTKLFVKRMVTKRREPTTLATTLAAAGSAQDGLVLLSIKSIRPIIEGAVESMNGQLPPQVTSDLATLIKTTDFMALRISLDGKEKLQLMASATDDTSAEELEKSLQSLIHFARDTMVANVKVAAPDDGSQTSAAMQKYIDRVSEQLSGMLTPKRTGKRMMLEFEGIENTATIGTLVGLLLPAVQSAREAARRMQSSNNLKQLGLAMHNYESAYKRFPATAILERDTGKPLLSWRVAILPYIEQAALYNQFHLDEPWDSEHNIKLLEMMPATYAHPSRILPPGYTIYVAPVNEETLLRKDEMTKIASITDGTSNTIMLLEAGDEAAVPWTKPEDLDIDFANPLDKLASPNGRGMIQVLMGDASVHAMSLDIDLETWKAMLTRAGGEIVDIDF